MKRSIRWAALLLCLILMLPLAACGGGPADQGDTEDGGTQPPAETAGEDPSSDPSTGTTAPEESVKTPETGAPATGDDSTGSGFETEPGDTSSGGFGTEPGTTGGGFVTEPGVTDETYEPFTEQPATGTTGEGTTTPEETTAPKTPDPPTPTVASERPAELHAVYIAADRFLIYGVVEKDSVVKIYSAGQLIETANARGECFYAELFTTGADQYLDVTATAPGKKESSRAGLKVSYQPRENTAETFAGKNSQLFYTLTLPFYNGSYVASPESLAAAKTFLLGRLQQIRAATGKNTEIIYVICPNPVAIYYDSVNSYIPQHPAWNTPASQLISYMKDVEGIRFADVYSALMAHRDEPIFHQTDTHWTEVGAYYAYQQMMGIIQTNFKNANIWQPNSFILTYKREIGGDLTSSVTSLPGAYEWTPYLTPNFSSALQGPFFSIKRATSAVGVNVGAYPTSSKISNENLPVGYLIGDSYGANFLPFAALGFRELYMNPGVLWNYPLDFNLLQEKKPDYIIYVYTERNFFDSLGQVYAS